VAKLTWLHISDLHFSSNIDRYDQNRVLQPLLKTLRASEKEFCNPDLIVVTGDIGLTGGREGVSVSGARRKNTGKEECREYARAVEFFDQLLEATGLDKSRLFVVPGNHDVDREESKYCFREFKDGTEIDQFFGPEDASARQPYFDKRFRAYCNFLRGYFGDLIPCDHDRNIAYTRIVEVDREGRALPHLRVGILGFNSCWLSRGDSKKDHKNLVIGRRVVADAWKVLEREQPELTISLVHHPLEELNESDREEVERFLYRHTDFILFGHMHRQKTTNVFLGADQGQVLLGQSGACYQGSKWPNSAAVVTVDTDTNRVFVYPIRFSKASDERWVLDTEAFPDKGDYIGDFALPKKLVGPKQPRGILLPPVKPQRIDCSEELRLHEGFVPRPILRKWVEEFIKEGASESGYLLITGGAGTGKSAFIADVIRREEKASNKPTYHFISRRRPGWDNPQRFLLSLVAQLASKYGLEEPQERAALPENERFYLMLELVSKVRNGAKPEVIYLDGLDESFGPTGRYQEVPGLPGVLPSVLPKGILMVLTSRPGEHLSWLADPTVCRERRIEDADRLETEKELGAFRRAENRRLGLKLAPHVARAVVERSELNFLFMKKVLWYLNSLPERERSVSAVPVGLEGWLKQEWQRLLSVAKQSGKAKDDVMNVIGLLAIAREPLDLNSIDLVLGPRSSNEEIVRMAEEWLQPSSEPYPRRAVRFFHSSFPEFILEQIPTKALDGVRTKLATACERHWGDNSSFGSYSLKHAHDHLYEAREWERLGSLIVNPFYLQKLARDNMIADLVQTLGQALACRGAGRWTEAFQELYSFLDRRISRLFYFPEAVSSELGCEALGATRVLTTWVETQNRSLLAKKQGPPSLRVSGHSAPVYHAVFSHDDKLIASASDDNTVRIWETNSGKLLRVLEGHTLWVSSAVFSHDDKLIASASYDKSVRIWETNSGKLLRVLKGHTDWVISAVFSHDDKLIASASDDNTVRIWETNSGKLLRVLEGHTLWVRSAVFSHDDKLIASASYDKSVRIWETTSGKLLRVLEGHTDGVSSAVFSHDDRLIASASGDNTVRIWETTSGKLLRVLKGHTGWVRSAVFSHDYKLIASASYDKTVRIWDVHSGELKAGLLYGFILSGIAWVSPGMLFVVDETSAVYKYTLTTPGETARLKGKATH
jgi:WD40 repeat protein